ncbi:MAG: hypothetical protein E6J61_12185 [Deltaproteobacteria bacterium]|nr:MAG: hypothetical protein E6J61_12185 [Deltaproteobacteria bacterium]
MPLHRERTDPVRTPDDLGLVHRRWIVPDDVGREVGLAAAARLWHALFDLKVLDRSQEVFLFRLQLPAGSQEESGLPAVASAGAILAGASAATAVTQVVHAEKGFRDPYLVPGGGYRDYTLYAVGSPRHLLLPLAVSELVCGNCGHERAVDPIPFTDAGLLDLDTTCPGCGATPSPDSDRVRLRSGSIFLLGEASARAALSIELPMSPPDEEMPDEEVAAAIEAAFGPTDELSDDGVEPS